MVQRPEVADGFATVGHNDQGSFAAEVVDEKLEEGIDGESLCRECKYVTLKGTSVLREHTS